MRSSKKNLRNHNLEDRNHIFFFGGNTILGIPTVIDHY